MPKLNNDRNELYARMRAKGLIPSKAAIAAGYATGSAIYSKLEEDDEVLQRIAELIEEGNLKKEQARAAARASGEKIGELVGVGRAWVMKELAENAAMARMEGKFSDSNAALIKIGEELGMFKGTGDNDKDTGNSIPTTLDFDAITQLTDTAHQALKPPEKIPAIPVDDSDIELAESARIARLLDGQLKNTPSSKRPLTTGSETDIAMTPDAMPDEDDDIDREV
jgi:hypothetical protein